MGAWIGSSQYPQIISHHLRLSPAIIGYLVICYPPRLADIWLRWYGQPMKTALFSPDNEVCSGRGYNFGPIFGTRSCMMCWMRSNIKSNTHDWFSLMCYSMCFVSKYVKNQYRNITNNIITWVNMTYSSYKNFHPSFFLYFFVITF